MKIVLFDRDGTLVVGPADERVDSVQKVVLFPDTLDALRLLAENDIAIAIITNQAGIAEGLITEAEFWDIHTHVLEKLAPSGITVVKTYLNGDGIEMVNEWRKPGPGMLLQAAEDFDIDLTKTYMVGDRFTDVQAGINAGTKTIFVETGIPTNGLPLATFIARDLLTAAKYIVAHKDEL